MRGYIGLEVGKEVGEYYQDLVEKISSEFDLSRLSKKKRNPHITIKSPFEVDSLEGVERVVEDFCSDIRKSRFWVNGFGSFDDNLIYLGVNPSIGAYLNVEKLLRGLERVEEITLDKYDLGDKVFHVTVAKGKELEGKFDDVWNYVSNQRVNFRIPFNHVSIFGKENGKSEVVSRYEID
jgi:2'-5' RNA ligase